MQKTIISNCKDFGFLKDTFFSISKDGILFMNDEEICKRNLSFRGQTENAIWLFDETNFETYVYDEYGKLIKRIADYGITLKAHLKDNIWLVGLNDGVNNFSAEYDLLNERVLKKYQKMGFTGVRLLCNGGFISRNRKKIGLFDFNNNCIWERTFTEIIDSDRASTTSKTLLLGNNLFLSINGSDSGGLVCLNANNGEVDNNFPDLKYEIFSNDKVIYTTCFENRLCQLNPENNKISEWDINGLIKENGFDSIHDHRCTANEQKFYFTQTVGDVKAKFGVLDWDKKELVFKHEFLPKNGGVAGIKTIKKKIFIKMQDDSLHIFEE